MTPPAKKPPKTSDAEKLEQIATALVDFCNATEAAISTIGASLLSTKRQIAEIVAPGVTQSEKEE